MYRMLIIIGKISSDRANWTPTRNWTPKNAAVRFRMNIKKRDHVSTDLDFLHWLPIKYRMEFKIPLIIKLQCTSEI